LLAHGRWFSPGTPASSTTKTGRHDMAEILLNVVLNTVNQSINQSNILSEQFQNQIEKSQKHRQNRYYYHTHTSPLTFQAWYSWRCKLVIWAQTSPLSENMQSCTCFLHVSKTSSLMIWLSEQSCWKEHRTLMQCLWHISCNMYN
jgi:hypothetical protein